MGVHYGVRPTGNGIYIPPIITNGLVMHLDAGNFNSYPGSGTTWTDLSGNGNNGTLVNGVDYNSSNGGIMVFDGTNDYVSTTALLNYSSATWCAWFKVPSFSNDGAYARRLLHKSDNSGNHEYNCVITNSGSLSWNGYGASAYSFQLSTTIQTNTWYYFSGSYDVSFGYLYLNGSLINSATKTQSISNNSTTGLYIGRVNFTNVARFLGNISCVQIYNRALTDSEISQNFNALRTRFGL